LTAVARRQQNTRAKFASRRRSMIAIQRIIDVHRLEVKERGNILEASTAYYRKEAYIYIDANPLTKILGLHVTTGFYIKSSN
jgi:hypothetical protein